MHWTLADLYDVDEDRYEVLVEEIQKESRDS
jgi:hypothetical protein